MKPTRVEAFSDGAIAIIITVMVLGLPRPTGASFHDLHPLVPALFAYLLSFVNLGIYWNTHHHLLRTARSVTSGIMWSNLALLFWLSLIPFCTEWMSSFRFASDTIAAYSAVLALSAICFIVLQHSILYGHDSTALQEALGSRLKEKLSLVSNLLCIPLAYLWRWGALSLLVIVAASWLVPDRRLERYLTGCSEPIDETA